MRCTTCFHHCDLDEGQTGLCRVRTHRNGQIVPKNYGKITSLALDPIEKKPLANFYPGSMIISVGSYGCNLRCPFCQNHEIAQNDLDGQSDYMSPEDLVELALDYVPDGNIGLAFTYNEPLVGWEYVRDSARLARQNGLKNVLVTNGTADLSVLEQIEDYIDAYNIDLKGFDQDFYDYVSGDLEQVRKFIERAASKGHVEVTTLVIPGKNDDPEKIEALAAWLASIDPSITLHLTRYFPRFHETIPVTPLSTLEAARQAAGKHLDRVVLGNV